MRQLEKGGLLQRVNRTTYENLSYHVDYGRYEEEYQTDGNEGRQLESVGLAELVGDDTGHRVPRVHERPWQVVRVADEHGDGHRFPQGASQRQDVAGEDARARVGKGHRADDVQPRASKTVGGLFQFVGHHRDEFPA